MGYRLSFNPKAKYLDKSISFVISYCEVNFSGELVPTENELDIDILKDILSSVFDEPNLYVCKIKNLNNDNEVDNSVTSHIIETDIGLTKCEGSLGIEFQVKTATLNQSLEELVMYSLDDFIDLDD